jgi:predicted dehydrogenase
VDLARWVLGFPAVIALAATLRAGGLPVRGRAPDRVEDHAGVQLEPSSGTAVRLACSWWLPAGQDSVIEASSHGTGGGA